MKRLIFILMLLFASVICANATEITVSSSQWFQGSYRYAGTTATLRIYYSQSFLSNTNVNVVGSAIGSNGWYKSVACTISSATLNCASFTFQSTVDSNKPNTRFFAVLYDQSGVRRETLMGDASGWIVPASPTSTTVAQLINAQGTGIPNPPVSYLNSSQVQALINTAVGTLNDASDTVKGRTKLSDAPASATNPIALGVNHVFTNDLTGTPLAPVIAPSLKPSGTAATTDEALRALGTTAGTALRGTYGTAFGFSTLVLKRRLTATSFTYASTATWADLSPTGANCTQTGSNRPTLVADVWNKRAAVRFTRSSSQYMLCGNSLDSVVIGTSGKKWISVDVVWPLSGSSQALWSMHKITGGDSSNGGCNGGVGYPDGCGRGPRIVLLKQSDTGLTTQPKLSVLVSSSSDLDYLGTPLSLVYYGSADVYNQPVIIVSVFNQDGATDADKEQASVNGVNQTMQADHAGGTGASQNFNSAQMMMGADLSRATTSDAYAPINAADLYYFESTLLQGDLSTQAAKDELAQFVAGLVAYYAIPYGSQVYTSPSGNTGINAVPTSNPLYIGGAGTAGSQTAMNENTSTSSAAVAQWRLKNNAGNEGAIALYGSNSAAGSGWENPNATTLVSSAGDINLLAVGNKPIRFWSNILEVARFSETNQALYLFGGTIGRGTTSNTDLVIELTMSGAGSNTYTYAKTYTHLPLCTLTKRGGAATITPWYDSTTTTLTMHGDASAVITAHCFAQD